MNEDYSDDTDDNEVDNAVQHCGSTIEWVARNDVRYLWWILEQVDDISDEDVTIIRAST